jgi:hypothetical protein
VAGEKAFQAGKDILLQHRNLSGKSNLIRQVYHPMLAQAGLPKIRFHDLRQTACSLLLAAGVALVVASGREETSPQHHNSCGTTSTLQIRKKKH